MSFAYVVDNSVVTGWWHAGQANDYTRALRELIPESRIHAPQLWTLEFANVLRKLRVTGRLTDADLGAVVAQVNAVRIIIEPQVESVAEVLERALRFELSAYDAAYLGVALRLRLPIACKDGALARAAEAAGVGVFQP